MNPQNFVAYWKEEKRYGPLTDNFANFLYYWRPHGPCDFKEINPIYDAFGNFEFGASGCAAGFSLGQLQAAGEAPKLNLNNAINVADIASGYYAILNGGTLSSKMESLLPSVP